MSRGESSRSLAGTRRSAVRPTMRWAIAAAVAALTLAPAAARAQTGTATVQISIPTLLTLSVSPTTFGFPAVTDAEYTAGYVGSSSGPTLTHRGNVPYRITINAQGGATNMTFTPAVGRSDADPNKPVGDVTLQATTQGVPGSWTTLTSAPVDFIDRAARGPTQTSTLAARLALSYTNDPPGTYVTTVVFTMVAQ
jgi:hypothetical protein